MSKARICFLGSTNAMIPQKAERDLIYEFNQEFPVLHQACADENIQLDAKIWDNPIELNAYDGVIIGTTWDYFPQKEKFLGFLDKVEEFCPLYNPSHVIKWNIEKSYLRTLAEAGAPSIPTLWCEEANSASIEDAFAVFETDGLVIKPLVGGGAWRQVFYKKGQNLPNKASLPPAQCLIQPFLPSVPNEGEYSFVFFGGEFSHSLQKIPKFGDYRVQSAYGAAEYMYSANNKELDLCHQVLDLACKITGEDTFLYARVDMVRGLEGQLVLMELEIIEPYLYPEQGPYMGAAFTKALMKKLNL